MDLNIGRMPHGPRNSIADVAGVRVGHCTVDDERHKTGVTVILIGLAVEALFRAVEQRTVRRWGLQR